MTWFTITVTLLQTEEKITNGTNERIPRIIREIRPICEIRDGFLYFSECSESVTLISRENEPSQKNSLLIYRLLPYLASNDLEVSAGGTGQECPVYQVVI